jgi:hypothetical protein
MVIEHGVPPFGLGSVGRSVQGEVALAHFTVVIAWGVQEQK